MNWPSYIFFRGVRGGGMNENTFPPLVYCASNPKTQVSGDISWQLSIVNAQFFECSSGEGCKIEFIAHKHIALQNHFSFEVLNVDLQIS